MNKKKLQSNLTKKTILDKSKELFIQKGFSATSVENISQATGYSKGNIFYHFKSKEGLFLQILEDWENDWEEQWSLKKHQYSSSAEQLYGIAEHMVVNDLNHPLTTVADEFFTNEKSNSEVYERLNQTIDLRLKFIQKLLSEGVDSGEFQATDTLMLAKVLDGFLSGISFNSKGLSLDQTLELYRKSIEVFLKGISKQSNRRIR